MPAPSSVSKPFHRCLLLVLVFWGSYQSAFGQTTLGNSPFSRQPIGEAIFDGNSRSSAMGQVSIGNPGTENLNLFNPAELTQNRVTNFETSILSVSRRVSTNAGSLSSSGLILNNIAFGFPVGKTANMAFGLRPSRFLDYDVNYRSAVTGSTSDTASYRLTGTGGISKIFLSGARKINDELSIGLEAALNFGTITLEREFAVIGRRDEPISQIANEKRARWFAIKPGIMYRKKLDSSGKRFITFSACSEWMTASRVRSKILSQQLTRTFEDPFFEDTLQSSVGNVLQIPPMYSLGISYSKNLHYQVAADFHYQNLSSFRGLDGSRSPVSSIMQAGLGVEWLPNINSTKYYNIIVFRAGINYSQQMLALNNNQTDDLRMTLGIGLPMIRKEAKFTRPYVNLLLFAGQRGSISQNGLQEQYFGAGLSLVLNDLQWFQKYKLD